MANLGLKLYELRKKAKISQEEFAEIVDTSRQAVSKWERDESEPDLNKIILIAKYYNVSIDYLLDYTIDDSLLTEYLAKMEKVINEEDFSINYDEIKLWLDKYPNNEELIKLTAIYFNIYGMRKNDNKYLENSIKCAKKLIAIKQKENNLHEIDDLKMFIAQRYALIGKYDEAKKYLPENYSSEKNLLSARLEFEKKEYDKSLEILFDDYLDSIGNILTNVFLQIANFIYIKKYDQAYKIADWGINFAKSIATNENLIFSVVIFGLYIKVITAIKLEYEYQSELNEIEELLKGSDVYDVTTQTIKNYNGKKSSVYISVQLLVKFMNQSLNLIKSSSLELKTKLNNICDKYKERFLGEKRII